MVSLLTQLCRPGHAFIIGPAITDAAGNLMNQDGDYFLMDLSFLGQQPLPQAQPASVPHAAVFSTAPIGTGSVLDAVTEPILQHLPPSVLWPAAPSALERELGTNPIDEVFA